MNTSETDYHALIRAHLKSKSADELIDLLLDLIREVDEATRQKFWSRIAPSGVATADLHYPSPQIFLAELDEFATEVEDGRYFDEEAQMYYGEDPVDRDYHGLEYEPDFHKGLQLLRDFFTEADSYFQAGRYDVVAGAYQRLIDITLNGDPYETMGIDDPLSEIGQYSEPLAERYFRALQESRPQAEFFEKALQFLDRHDSPYRSHAQNFFTLVGEAGQPALRAHLEVWADERARQEPVVTSGVPFQLRLLLRSHEKSNQPDAVRDLWIRFRRRFPALYVPLLADREAAEDWPAVIEYGQEALDVADPARWFPAYRSEWAKPDEANVRDQLARAYQATGDPGQAFAIYRPLFDAAPNFDHYARTLELAAELGQEQADAFRAETIASLREKGPRQRYLLSQIHLGEGDFDQAYALVENLSGYQGLEETKLVAKAHLLAALGSEPTPKMGKNLRDLYTKVETGSKEPVQYLRDVRPQPAKLPREMALTRAEAIYRRLMQAHIDNGRKTYATAAYYCALLGEIAAHEGGLSAFSDFYDDLMNQYKRYRALRREMEAKVGPVLRNG